MNVTDIVKKKKQENKTKAEKLQYAKEQEHEKKVRESAAEWIRRFETSHFHERSEPEEVANIYMNHNRMEMYCPNIWISTSMGGQSAHYPREVYDMIKRLDKKFGIDLMIDNIVSTKYCGSIPQDTVHGIKLWIRLKDDIEG